MKVWLIDSTIPYQDGERVKFRTTLDSAMDQARQMPHMLVGDDKRLVCGEIIKDDMRTQRWTNKGAGTTQH